MPRSVALINFLAGYIKIAECFGLNSMMHTKGNPGLDLAKHARRAVTPILERMTLFSDRSTSNQLVLEA